MKFEQIPDEASSQKETAQNNSKINEAKALGIEKETICQKFNCSVCCNPVKVSVFINWVKKLNIGEEMIIYC